MNKNTTQIRWTAIAESLRASIERGELLPGEKLPSETEMAAQWKVSTMTVHRAMQELQREGLITRKRKAGTIVAERPEPVARRIAMVLGHWGDRLISSYALGIRDSLADHSRLIPYDSRFTTRHERACLEQIEAENQTDAIVICATCATENMPLLLHLARKHPMVFIDRLPIGFETADAYWDAVMTDNYGSIWAGLELLRKRGHQRIAYFMGDVSSISSARERFEGYQRFMAEQGYKNVSAWVRQIPTELSHLTYSEQVERHLRDLLSGPEPITAVCCQQDQTMAAVLESCVQLRVAVPEQLEVLSFCDSDPTILPLGRSVHRLEQRTYEMGAMAARRLMLRLENPMLPSQQMRLMADLHPASTNGPRPHPEGYRNGQSTFLPALEPHVIAPLT